MSQFINIIKDNVRLYVSSPYNSEFVAAARQVGSWDAMRRLWCFDLEFESDIRRMLVEHYGTDGTVNDSVKVRIRFLRDVAVERQDVRVAGRSIARAFNRDSGAVTGQGVTLITGRIDSGGSRAGWHTAVMEGSEFLVSDFPRGKVASDDDVDIVIVDEVVNLRSLEEERTRLLDRLEEIEAILGGELRNAR